MTSERLRGAVLWTRPQPQTWEVGAVAQLQAIPGVELVGCYAAQPEPTVAAAWRAVRPLVFRPHSTRSAAFPPLPTLESAPGALDFVLQLGPDAPAAALLIARLGTWAFRPGDGGLASLCAGAAVASGQLVQREDGAVLRQGHLKTMRHSPSRNADQLYNEMARWPADVCRRILGGGSLSETGTAPPLHFAINFLPPVTDGSPSNGQALRLLARAPWDFAVNFLDTLFLDAEWNIGIIEAPVQRFLDPSFQPNITWLPGPAPGRFAADSFVVEWQGRRFLYFEDLDFRSYKGRIWAVELRGTTPLGPPVTVFDPPHHLSYPYLLEHQGELYMVPESSAVREVAIYKAVELPARWEKVAVLLKDVPALDSSVFFHDGRWWLLATQADYTGDPNAHLYLWHAPDLLGPWQPHPGNPVKIDVRSARPAGPPFAHEGHLYRPAQDCSQTYGGRIALLRIDTLTPTDFSEQLVRWLDPFSQSRYPGGLHTLSGWGNVTVVDAKRTLFNHHACAHAFRRKFGRLLGKLSRRKPDGPAPESHL